MNYEKIVKIMREELRIYIKKSGIKSLVLGISGGIDSAVVAAIAAPVCLGSNVNLMGVSLPSKTNKVEEISRANSIGSSFCTTFFEISIDDIFESMKKILSIACDKRKKATQLGNCKARIRMIKLYDTAFANDGLVLSTDNLTELNLGFWTLHGDVGDFGLIQNLWKTEVYGLSLHIAKTLSHTSKKALIDCVNAVPTDGLGITSSDFDQLGCSSYDEVDRIFLEDVGSPPYCKVNKMRIKNKFKRNNPYNISRDKFLV